MIRRRPDLGQRKLQALAVTQADQIDKLRAALGRSRCPYPVPKAEDETAAACVRAGVCGCENGPLLDADPDPIWPGA